MPTDIELIECWNCNKINDISITDHCSRCLENCEEPSHIDEHEEEK